MSRLLALLTLACLAPATEPTKQTPEQDLGTWHVSRLLFHNEFALTQGLTRAQARAQLGSALVITKNGIDKLGTQQCGEGRVVNKIERTELLRSNKLTPPPGKILNLGLPAQVTIFNYGCLELWLRADGHMIAGIDAYYFELTKYSKIAPAK